MIYRYYIGANNKTKKVEREKIIDLIASQFFGFTAFNGVGYWQGRPERNMIIEIESDKAPEYMQSVAHDLCKKLDQEAVGLATIGKMQFIK